MGEYSAKTMGKTAKSNSRSALCLSAAGLAENSGGIDVFSLGTGLLLLLADGDGPPDAAERHHRTLQRSVAE